ncbi:acyl-CoA thioesterase [Falsiroseomonas oryzae]|uniref:acyl-CoA thioesterase n=1 Tax=Falsiroseomonas oryzae TaxID=2766473 RepID=UPI0022EA389F|nr:thioesterase family protein [Roseomonas sp. MO-31]
MSDQAWTILRPHVIRWSECDLYGHVNHAAYLTLFEDLRVDHWQALTGHAITPDRPGPVVAQIEARYLRAVGFGDAVQLACRASAFRRTSFVHDYALLKEGEACCTGRAVCVVTRQDTGEKVPLWPELRAKLLAEGAAEG